MKKWFVIFFLLIFYFKGAFSTHIFQDDFFLFTNSLSLDLSPYKNYGFYRPIGIELFYFLASQVNNLFIVRLFVFFVFLVGLIYLNRIINFITRNPHLGLLAITMYAFSFIHIYQLYWLATFQEIAMFTFCAASFYFFLHKKWLSLPLFVLAMLCREQAFALPIVIFFILTVKKIWDKRFVYQLILMLLTLIPFLILYKINYALVAIRPEYAPQINPRVIANNYLWYFLWSLGFPIFLPDFMPSIFSQPLPGLLTTIKNTFAYPYIFLLTTYILTLLAVSITHFKKIIRPVFICICLFSLYIIPISLIIHKWPVRLTVPLVFVTIFQAMIILSIKSRFRYILIVLYFTYNFLGTRVHESVSTYQYESAIVLSTEKKILKKNFNNICFRDRIISRNGWEGSQKLKLTLFDQWFLKYYFPKDNKMAYYGFETGAFPPDCLIIPAEDILASASDK